jgi:hypothetical protein
MTNQSSHCQVSTFSRFGGAGVLTTVPSRMEEFMHPRPARGRCAMDLFCGSGITAQTKKYGDPPQADSVPVFHAKS